MDLVSALENFSRNKQGSKSNFISYVKSFYIKAKNKYDFRCKVNSTIKYSSRIFKNYRKNNKNKELCLIFTSTTANPNHVRSELIFSEILIKNGYEVVIILSGDLYENDEFNSHAEYNKNNGKIRRSNAKFCNKLVSSSNKKIINLSSLQLTKREKELILKFTHFYRSKNIK